MTVSVTYVASGAITGGVGNISPPLPAGIATDDILIMFVETAEQDVATPTGWNADVNSFTSGTTTAGAGAATATRAQMFWQRYAGGAAPTIVDGGDHQIAQIHAFRGCVTSGIPFDPTPRPGGSNASVGSRVMVSSTTAPARDNTLWVFMAHIPTDSATAFATWSQSGADFANLTKRTDTGDTSGNGGEMSMATAEQVTAATKGPTVTCTFSGNSTCGVWTIVLKPNVVTHAVAGVLGTVSAVASSIRIDNRTKANVTGVLGSVTGTANVKNKIGHAAAGVLGSVTGTANVQNKDGVAVTGVLGSVTGAASVTLLQHVSAAGVLGPVEGAINLLDKDGVAVTGVLGSVTGAGVVTLKQNVALAGVLGAVDGAVDIAIEQDITVAGVLGSVTGAIDAANKIASAIAGVLGPVTGAASVTLSQHLALAGVLGSVEGAINLLDKDGVAVAGVLGAVDGAALITFVPIGITVAGTLGTVTGAAVIHSEIANDRREQILARLALVLAALPGVVTSKRNDPEAPGGLLPAVMMLDSDETTEREMYGRKRPSNQVHIIDLRPEVYIIAEGTDPEDTGAKLNELQDLLVKAVLNDSQLKGLTKDGIGILYDGSRAAFATGRGMEGEMAVDFTFNYLLRADAPTASLPIPDDPWLPDEPPRERVLAAIARVLAAVPGIATFARNELAVPEDLLPAVMMLDGDETANGNDSDGRPTNTPKRVTIEPEVYLIVDAAASVVGTALNVLRYGLVQAVLNDALVSSLVHEGLVKYEGLQTGLALGRSMAGEMGLKFSTTYVLKP